MREYATPAAFRAAVEATLRERARRLKVPAYIVRRQAAWEIETDCDIGPDRLAYSNNRRYGGGDRPVVGLYVDPRNGLIREQRAQIHRRSPISRPLSIRTV